MGWTTPTNPGILTLREPLLEGAHDFTTQGGAISPSREVCAAEGCTNLARRRGLCEKHAYHETSAPLIETPSLETQLLLDRNQLKLQNDLATLRAKYKSALQVIEKHDRERAALVSLGDAIDPVKIVPHHGSGTSEATPVLVASDWHVEESVGAEIGGLNRYNLEIADERATRFFQAGLRLIRMLNKDVAIYNVVMPLLGDFITGNIHGEENAEKNLLTPTKAIEKAQNLLIGGIEFFLNHTKFNLLLPTASGNHSRTTHTTRFASEAGHSLEYLMYLHLAAYFRNEKRVKFIISDSPHVYVDLYDQAIRFHHGHAIQYKGNPQGFYAAVYRKIDKWNQGKRADLDVFGHFHQYRNGGNFLANGSMIGYNSFALWIGASYEPPKQMLFLMDKKRGKTADWPILFLNK